MTETFAYPAVAAYLLMNILAPFFAIRRMRQRQSSADVSVLWQLMILGAVFVFLSYSVERADPVFMFGQVTTIIALSTIIAVVLWYRRDQGHA